MARTKAHVDAAAAAVVDSAHGAVVSSALDFLSKELVRRREEERVDAFVKGAELTRRIREAEEAGRRQAEERVRRKREFVHRNVMSVHNATASSYVDSILEATIEGHAAKQAMTEVVLRKQNITPSVTRLEENGGTEAVVNDLLTGFVFPQVAREQRREKSLDGDRRPVVHAAAAAMSEIEKSLKK